MYSKIFKTIWVISLLVVMGTFLYAYATLPEVVRFGEAGAGRSLFFYSVLTLLALLNGSAFLLPKYLPGDAVVSWFFGSLATFHLFAISALILLGVINSSERYDYSGLGPVVTGSFVIFCSWMLALPFVLRKKTSDS